MAIESKVLPNNVYDRMLIITFAFQVGGIIGGPFQPVRILIVGLLPVLLVRLIKNKSFLTTVQYEVIVFTMWLLYGFVLSLFSNNIVEGIKEIGYLTINFLAFLLVIALAYKANYPQYSIVKGWLLLFILTVPMALYELMFDSHLILDVESQSLTGRRYAAVSFGNLNNYNNVLIYIIPMILYGANRIKTKWPLLLFLILSFLIIMNGSRAALICLIISILVYVFSKIKNMKKFFGFAFLGLAAFLSSIYLYPELFNTMIARFREQGVSDTGRSELLNLGIREFIDSNLFGVGPANFVYIMRERYLLQIPSPHNLFLEVGVQYGVYILILFLGLFLKIYLQVKKNHSVINKTVIVMCLLFLPFAAVINSGYITGINIWLFIASLMVISNKKFNETYN